jgi:hypothetical protein
MKLITEVNFNDLKMFEEGAEGSKKHLYVEGPYISVNIPNRNKRIYSKGIMEPVVESFINEKVKNNTAYGEWGHPSTPKINEERLSHRIVSLKWDGNNVIGKAVVFEEGMGKLMRSIIESGGRLGMSTRGLGSVKANDSGLQEVQNDFKLVTVDAVTDPSGVGCFVNGVLESVDWVFDATKGTWMEAKVEEFVEKTQKLSPHELEEKQLFLWKYYLEGLARKP